MLRIARPVFGKVELVRNGNAALNACLCQAPFQSRTGGLERCAVQPVVAGRNTAPCTPADKAGEWLPWVHITTGNLKTFLLGTYHGVSGKYFQEYLNEFCYRFNRRQVLHEFPLRLLNACVQHVPIRHAVLCLEVYIILIFSQALSAFPNSTFP